MFEPALAFISATAITTPKMDHSSNASSSSSTGSVRKRNCASLVPAANNSATAAQLFAEDCHEGQRCSVPDMPFGNSASLMAWEKQNARTCTLVRDAQEPISITSFTLPPARPVPTSLLHCAAGDHASQRYSHPAPMPAVPVTESQHLRSPTAHLHQQHNCHHYGSGHHQQQQQPPPQPRQQQRKQQQQQQ
eukprot:scpid101774/ scgid31485/ 